MHPYSLTSLMELPFKRALRETCQALEDEQFIVITKIDLQKELAEKLGQKIRSYTILGVWAPSWEFEALNREPDMGLLMPSHVCLWDNGDDTCALATAALKRLCDVEHNPPLAEAVLAVNARLRAVVSSGASASCRNPSARSFQRP